MEFRRLRYFVAVAEELSFTRAAERLYTSQPSLSEQIRCLEESLGQVLFIRSPRKVELTEVGRVFLEEARLVLRQVEVAVARAQSAGEKARESLTIGFVPSAEVQIFPVVIPALRLQHPNVQLILKSLTPPEQQAALSHGEIDVAFTRPPLHIKTIRSEVILTETLRVFIREDHALASLSGISPADLNHAAHVSTDPSYSGALRQVTDEYLARHEVKVGEVQISSNILTSMNLVAGGFGFALLPAYAETFSPRNVVSRPVLGSAPTIDLIMAHAKDEHGVTPALSTLLELVRNTVRSAD